MAQSTSLQVVWLDSTVHDNINRELLTSIREINPEAMEFDNQDECLRFLGNGVDEPRRFIFIVSGVIAEKLVPDIQQHKDILSIYVYCAHISKHEEWSRQYEKVEY
ncbi:unnamed protein product [Adineta steineri]|uniref:Uncharacterized protein n=1 Tax=Adineta steineri TaxID=433720 RepID=A0A819CE68_9BILA|nr:unnamed protein product [Adineta steineri]CAF0787697.1 unnamed protein product [Adineta steineri]CAF0972577.1 unnamed protein product [Adineta steineri]CAF3816507.1 unnamed protein product [Adineta steineri]